jgi:hypothetical protein
MPEQNLKCNTSSTSPHHIRIPHQNTSSPKSPTMKQLNRAVVLVQKVLEPRDSQRYSVQSDLITTALTRRCMREIPAVIQHHSTARWAY